MKKYLLDTNILMSVTDLLKLVEKLEDVSVSYIVLDELDNLKTHEGIKGFRARRAIRNLKTVEELIAIIPDYETGMERKNDDIIISTALHGQYILVTNDIGMSYKAKARGVIVEQYVEIVTLPCGCEVNEYKGERYHIDDDGTIGLKYKQFKRLNPNTDTPLLVRPTQFKSKQLGVLNALDIYQVCAMDSLVRDDITVISGHAGTGKTLLSLCYAFQEIESGRKRNLVVFANPSKVKGSEELGFYPGTRDEKLLSNSIGSILTSKLGSSIELEQLMLQDKIQIYPMSDIRGMEVNSEDIMYITEAQNVSKELMKLVIQRCQQGCKIIIEGDFTTQIDNYFCEGENNGMVALIECLKDYSSFCHVNLPIVRRSELANLVDNM